jgi:hypothetical protein
LTAQYGIGVKPGTTVFRLPRIALWDLAYEGLGEPGSMPNFKISQVHQYLTTR